MKAAEDKAVEATGVAKRRRQAMLHAEEEERQRPRKGRRDLSKGTNILFCLELIFAIDDFKKIRSRTMQIAPYKLSDRLPLNITGFQTLKYLS